MTTTGTAMNKSYRLVLKSGESFSFALTTVSDAELFVFYMKGKTAKDIERVAGDLLDYGDSSELYFGTYTENGYVGGTFNADKDYDGYIVIFGASAYNPSSMPYTLRTSKEFGAPNPFQGLFSDSEALSSFENFMYFMAVVVSPIALWIAVKRGFTKQKHWKFMQYSTALYFILVILDAIFDLHETSPVFITASALITMLIIHLIIRVFWNEKPKTPKHQNAWGAPQSRSAWQGGSGYQSNSHTGQQSSAWNPNSSYSWETYNQSFSLQNRGTIQEPSATPNSSPSPSGGNQAVGMAPARTGGKAQYCVICGFDVGESLYCPACGTKQT